MIVRIRWKTPSGEGAFPLREQPLYLVWIEGRLDRVGVPPTRGNGLRISPPDAGSRIRLEAAGEIRFLARGRSFRKVTLPLGRGLPFRLGDQQGILLAEEEEAPPADPLVGRVLGGNRLLERLGRGAVGAVYRALQLNLGREVALKILDPRLARDADMVASFRREARAAGQLVHPNIVQVYDVGEAEGFPFYSMELVAGGSLEDRLRGEGPLDWKAAVKAVRDCAQALTYAEEHDLIHRDVKPANLMVHPSGHVKLADLGLAATRGMIDREGAGGTPHFMAPEAIGSRPVDTRADLYSLGCTLFRLVTGRTPFSGESVREILLAHRDTPPPSFRKAGFPVPRELEDLLAALLAKDPEERPATASRVVETCERLLHAQRSRQVVPLLGILLIAAAGAFLWWSDRKPHGGEEVRVEYRQDPGELARSKEMARRLAEQKVQLRLAEAL
ncbi:MAG: serine/threonine-protein kinase, partial [Planctomycetota bacterium]